MNVEKRSFSRGTHHLLFAISVFLAVASPNAVAQASSPDQSSEQGQKSSQGLEIEEVTVTAERREVNLQEFGASVLAFTGSDLIEQNVRDLSDTQGVIPSLSFVDNGNTKFVNVRGAGINESAPNTTVGVAIHIDGAYIAKEFQGHDMFFDVERVEVLRGPQGTYVGQNASGGAIFVTSVRPDMEETTGYARVDIGNYEQRYAEGAVSVPLTDSLATRISVQSKKRDSFTTNVGKFGEGTLPVERTDPGIVDNHLVRFQLRYMPFDDLDMRFILQSSSQNTNEVARKPDVPESYEDPYTVSYDTKPAYTNKYDRYTLEGTWQTTDDYQLRFVGSYQDMLRTIVTDTDYTSPYTSPGTPQSLREMELPDSWYTAEVNLLSTTDSKLQWIFGASILNYDQHFTYQSVRYTTVPDYTTGLILNFITSRENQAIFGEISYEITPAWDIKVGGRYNWDQTGILKGSYIQPGGPLAGPGRPVEVTPDFSAPTGRILVEYKPFENHFFYATLSRGYKPGGWQANGNVYDEEIILNQEIGWKASFLDSSVQTSLSIFHMDYDGLQATVATDPTNPTSAVTTNVDNCVSQGLDFQLAAVSGNFELGFTGSYLDTSFGHKIIYMQRNTIAPGEPSVPTPVDVAGNHLQFAPELTGNAYVKYRQDLNWGGSLTYRLGWNYVDSQNVDFFETPRLIIPSHSLGDFRVSYLHSDGTWSVDAYVTNFTDDLYVANKTGDTAPGQVFFGAPRQFGVAFQYNF